MVDYVPDETKRNSEGSRRTIGYKSSCLDNRVSPGVVNAMKYTVRARPGTYKWCRGNLWADGPYDGIPWSGAFSVPVSADTNGTGLRLIRDAR